MRVDQLRICDEDHVMRSSTFGLFLKSAHCKISVMMASTDPSLPLLPVAILDLPLEYPLLS